MGQSSEAPGTYQAGSLDRCTSQVRPGGWLHCRRSRVKKPGLCLENGEGLGWVGFRELTKLDLDTGYATRARPSWVD